ncbi:MAG: hypothetical protein RR614_12030, partial [Eubacterium sp.]
AGVLLDDLCDFINNELYAILDSGQYSQAFDLINHIFLTMGEQEIDDSDGEITELAYICKDIWESILENSDAALERKMFQWFMANLDGSCIDYMEEYIEIFLFEHFKKPEYQSEKLKFSEKQANKYKKVDPEGYNAGYWATKHLEMMQALNIEDSEIDAYCENNLEIEMVRSFYVQLCIGRKDYTRAIKLLEEGKKVHAAFLGCVIDYSQKLKEIYRDTGDRDAYIKELWALVLKYKPGDVGVYKELKQCYSQEEWLEKREQVYKNTPPHSNLTGLYLEEGLYDRLLNHVLNAWGLHSLTIHEKHLMKLYPEPLLDKYEMELKTMAKQTSDRERYKEIVKILKRMQKYPDGPARVSKIVKEFKELYKRRPAMMEELNKI